jgi:hypothetical protein
MLRCRTDAGLSCSMRGHGRDLDACAHAAFFVGLSLPALLLVAIRNAWDLVTRLAPRRDNGP